LQENSTHGENYFRHDGIGAGRARHASAAAGPNGDSSDAAAAAFKTRRVAQTPPDDG
jgi:hypothetical protein